MAREINERLVRYRAWNWIFLLNLILSATLLILTTSYDLRLESNVVLGAMALTALCLVHSVRRTVQLSHLLQEQGEKE